MSRIRSCGTCKHWGTELERAYSLRFRSCLRWALRRRSDANDCCCDGWKPSDDESRALAAIAEEAAV